MENRIEIELSKTKIVLLLIAAIIFVILGILLASNPEEWTSLRHKSPDFVRAMGFISIVFFGVCGAFISRKLFDKKAGLIIDDNGITDNSNATSVGLIDWEDITGVSRVEIASTKILLLQIKNPDKYIERVKNALSKRAMKANHKMYGSPISIISSSLKIDFKDLEALVKSELKKNKK